MKKCVFIIPYFGKFNNYFQLFLNSCGANKDFNWLIITDDKTNYRYPSNVQVIYRNFNEVCGLFQSKFNFPISLEKPYKLCDFKPTYGYVFSDFISEFEFWGHCDVDVIFGNLNNFITDEMFEYYDKIFTLGHLTLYRNTLENNIRFMLPYKGKELYKIVLSSPTNHSFDEEFTNSINNIFIEHGANIFMEDLSANIYTKSSNFRIIKHNMKSQKYIVEKYHNKAIFFWREGYLIRNYNNGNQFITEEYPYIHLQSRLMKVGLGVENMNYFKIIPNLFEKVEMKVDKETLSKIKHKQFNLHYFKLRFNNLKIKIKKLLFSVSK